MKIQVTLPHEGIQRGVYSVGDKALKGLEQYLVRAGHARVVEGTREQLFVQLTQVDEPEIISTGDGVSATSESDVKFDRERYIAEYEAIYGRPVPGNISDSTLQDRVENPPDDTPDVHG